MQIERNELCAASLGIVNSPFSYHYLTHFAPSDTSTHKFPVYDGWSGEHTKPIKTKQNDEKNTFANASTRL